MSIRRDIDVHDGIVLVKFANSGKEKNCNFIQLVRIDIIVYSFDSIKFLIPNSRF